MVTVFGARCPALKGRIKALVKQRPQPGAEIVEVDVPSFGPEEVLVEVKATSICGTDVHIYDWNSWAQSRVKLPRIFGHELAGEIVEVGKNVKNIEAGDLISADSHIACGQCFQCRTGQSNICRNIKVLGVDVNGCFAEYLALPERNAWKVPKTRPLEIASIMDPLGNAVYATSSTEPSGESVAIFGCGPIGLFSTGIARLLGATSIYAIDVNNFRLRLAEKMGASKVFNPKDADVLREIREETNGNGVGVVMEMSGNAVAEAFQVLRPGGRLILFGIPPKPVELNIPEWIVFKGAQVLGIFGRKMFETWYTMEALLKSGRLDVTPVITHKMPFNELKKGMELMKSGNCGKVVLLR